MPKQRPRPLGAAQLSFAEARRRGPRIAVLPDAARVEERLGRLARERGFVPGRVAYSLAELGRELIREAQRAGACAEVASPFALQLRERSRGQTAQPAAQQLLGDGERGGAAGAGADHQGQQLPVRERRDAVAREALSRPLLGRQVADAARKRSNSASSPHRNPSRSWTRTSRTTASG